MKNHNHNRIKEYTTFVQESINDKHLLKACFVTGGPGSGKSYITEKTFNGPPVCFVDSDNIFERKMKQFELSLKIHQLSPKDLEFSVQLRQLAIQLTEIRKDEWINSLLPLIINGTGKDFEKIKEQKEVLNGFGYDVSMIFINTSLDVALERDSGRERTLGDDLVQNMWNLVQNNIGKFQSLITKGEYPGYYQIIDNNEKLEGEKQKEFLRQLNIIANEVIKTPLENRIGIELLSVMKENGLKYRADFYNYMDRKNGSI